MLPEVTLKDVSREDVDRISWWLEDEEVAAKWFGHYGCGDPVHRGYIPEHMLEAPSGSGCMCFSTPTGRYSPFTIRRMSTSESARCCWMARGVPSFRCSSARRSFGTTATARLPSLSCWTACSNSFRLEKAWVNVPEGNEPARGLFRKLGFVHEATRELCKRRDGSILHASIMVMGVREYRAREWRENHSGWAPIVTIAGLPGSGAKESGAYIARRMGSRFIDVEGSRHLSERLQCSVGELEAFETSFRSLWGRMLRALVVPMHWSPHDDPNFGWFDPTSKLEIYEPSDYITKARYLQELQRIVRKYAAEGNVVLYGHGSHVFVPRSSRGLSVYVSPSREWREKAIAEERGLSLEEAARWLKRADREALSVAKHLFDVDLLNTGLYDLSLNPERVAVETAAQAVVGASGISAEPPAAAVLEIR